MIILSCNQNEIRVDGGNVEIVVVDTSCQRAEADSACFREDFNETF